jgi:hypothetical protein
MDLNRRHANGNRYMKKKVQHHESLANANQSHNEMALSKLHPGEIAIIKMTKH